MHIITWLYNRSARAGQYLVPRFAGQYFASPSRRNAHILRGFVNSFQFFQTIAMRVGASLTTSYVRLSPLVLKH